MRYAFDDYKLDTERYELRRAGQLIHVGPQVFNVLLYLLEHHERVVSRQEFFERLWPEQFVSDESLGRCIREVRRALGETRGTGQYIQTVRGRGYRFVAAVSVPAEQDEGASGHPSSSFSSTECETVPEWTTRSSDVSPPSPPPSTPTSWSASRRQLTVLSCDLGLHCSCGPA